MRMVGVGGVCAGGSRKGGDARAGYGGWKTRRKAREADSSIAISEVDDPEEHFSVTLDGRCPQSRRPSS
jgi:hypothetical protein